MALIDKTFSEVIAFTRPASAPYVNSSGQTVTAGVNVPRFTHTTSGQPLGLLLESERQERAVIRNGNWRTPHRGTWVVRGNFDSSIILSGLGFYVEADGEGTIVITYSLSGSKVFSQGRLQYESAMRPTEDFNILDEERAVIARMEFIPAMLGDNEAAAMALGSVDVQPPLAALWAGGHKGFLWSSLPYYQDPAATTVATWGDPVGLISDDSGNGTDFTQATVTARPVLGRVPMGGRRNLVNRSEGSSFIWTPLNGATFTFDGEVPSGGYEASARVATPAGQVVSGVYQSSSTVPVPVGVAVIYRVLVKPLTAFDEVRLDLGGAPFSASVAVARFSLTEVNLISLLGSSSLWATIELRDDGFYETVISATSLAAGQPSVTVYNETTLAQEYLVAQKQVEIGATPTPYQAVYSAYSITEFGVPEVHYLGFDGIDDLLPTTLPAITNGTLVLAGTNGIWIDDDFNHAGGAFTVGPTTYTDGPAGILPIVGDLIVGGSFAIDRQLTAQERNRVISKLESMGAPGVFELGPELVVNGDFSDGLEGWESYYPTGTISCNLYDDGGSLKIEKVATNWGGARTSIATQTPGHFLTSGDYVQGTMPSGISITLGVDGPRGYLSTGGPGRKRSFVTSTNNFSLVGILVHNNGTNGVYANFDNISVRKLELIP